MSTNDVATGRARGACASNQPISSRVTEQAEVLQDQRSEEKICLVEMESSEVKGRCG